MLLDKFRVFVYMLMRDASLKQRLPCIMRISIFGAFSAGKKCALYTGKYGIVDGMAEVQSLNKPEWIRNSAQLAKHFSNRVMHTHTGSNEV